MSLETNAIYKKHEAFFRQMSDNLIKGDFTPIKKIYIDLMCLKDLRLGLLLSLATGDRTEYLKANLNHYNHSPLRNFLFAFPDFPYTEEQLQKMMMDSKFQRQAFEHAPDTVLLSDLQTFGKTLSQVNMRANYPDPVRICINAYPLKVGPVLSNYAQLLNTVHTDIPVTFEIFSCNPTKITSDTWCSFDYQFIDNIIPLARDTSCPWARACFAECRFQHLRIFAAPNMEPQIFAKYDEQIDWDNEEQVSLLFGATESIIGLMTNFRFTRFPIPVEESSDSQQPVSKQ